MSGGHFDYAYERVLTFAEELKNELDKNEEKHQFGEVTMQILRDIQQDAETTGRIMREVEWLFSGDHAEDSFVEMVNLHREGKHPYWL